MATGEPEDTLMVHEPQEIAMVYKEAVHEAQALNTDDIMSANTEPLQNYMDDRYGQEATTTIFVHTLNQHTTTLV